MINKILIILFSALCIFALDHANNKKKNEKLKEAEAAKKQAADKKKKNKHKNKPVTAEEVQPEVIEKQDFITKYYKVLIVLILIIGVLVRSVLFWQYPLGINQDEASVVYDTYADLEYGFDRNGDHNPVYSVAWGSGHSSLYITFSKPFIALFGLNMFSARIVNVLFSCIALFAFYGILKRLLSKKGALLGTLIFAVCPWHIMMARWALECNLFPNVFILATYFLVRGFENEKFYIPSLFVYALSLYAYGTSYMIVPVFVLIMAIYLMKHKKITLKTLIISAIVFILTAIPIMLFMAVNMLGAPEMDFGFMSVPKLINGRYNTTVTVLSGNFFTTSINNLRTFFKILFTQNDGLPWNAVIPYGTIFMFSIPFMLTGFIYVIYDVIKKKKTFNPNVITIAMTVSMFVLAMLSDLNINRANFPMVVITLLTVYGVYFVLKNIKQAVIPVVLVYLIAFGMFTNHYFTDYQEEIGWHFSHGFGDAIKYADEEASGNIYMTSNINAPYIKAMFYLKTDPQVFIDTVDYPQPDSQCRYVNSFDRYYTGVPAPLPEGDDNAYIFTNGEYDQRTDFNKDDYETKVFGHYTVAIKK